MTKLLISLFLVLFITTGPIFSRETDKADSRTDMTLPRHEFEVGIGAPINSFFFLEGLSTALGIALTAGLVYDDLDIRPAPVWYADYQYRFNKTISLGGSLDYTRIRKYAYQSEELRGDFSTNYYQIAIETNITYYRRQKFQMYGTAGLGIGIGQKYERLHDERQTFVIPNFHLTLLGLSFGQRFGGFLEIGTGYKGLLSCGIRGSF